MNPNPVGKSLAQASRDSKKTWSSVLPTKKDCHAFFTPNFKLAIACSVLATVSVLSVSVEFLKPTYFSGGDWFWMLALSCACTAASRATYGGTLTTDHMPAFKKDKHGGYASYLFSALLAAWMFGTAAIICMNTSTCDHVQLDGCDYMCTRCLEFDPPCREPNQLQMSIFSRFGLKMGSKISVNLEDPVWEMYENPAVEFDANYYTLKFTLMDIAQKEYNVLPSRIRPRGWDEDELPSRRLYKVGEEVEFRKTTFMWIKALVDNVVPVEAVNATWNTTLGMLDVVTARREVRPDTEFHMKVRMGNSQVVRIPPSVISVDPADTEWMYKPLERPPTRAPTPFPTEKSQKTPSPTPYTCSCENTCMTGPNMDKDISRNGFCEDGKDSVFLKNVSINDPMNLKFHGKVGEIAECWCSDTGSGCHLNPECRRSYKINVEMSRSGSIILTEEYILSNQEMVFNYDIWAYESSKLRFGAACAPGTDCEDCGPTIFSTVEPFKTCNDTTPAPTPFPFERPKLGTYKLWSETGKFLESGDIDVNSAHYTGNEHVCFDKFYIYWNYTWSAATFMVSLVMWRVSVYRYFSIKRKKFVMYPLDIDDWHLKVQQKDPGLANG